jgi:hypothetical protein
MAMGNDSLYTLIPLEEFKSLLGVDDREDKVARFCLVTATLEIEQYWKRKIKRKKYFEKIDFYGDLFVPLREYPVSEVLAVYSMSNEKEKREERKEKNGIYDGEMIEPELYRVIPDCGTDIDLPFAIELSLAFKYYKGMSAVKVVYWAGYAHNKVPSDLSAACLELASWNMNRYRGRRVGMTGNIRGAGKEGEHFEMSMPENVKLLLEPYKRKTI